MLPLVARLTALSATGAWLAVIAYLSLVPRVEAIEGSPYQELIANGFHYVSYVVLAGLSWGSLALWAQVSARQPARNALGIVFLAVTAYGSAMELLQGLVPTRSPSLSDAILDAAGAATGVAMAALLLKAIARSPALPPRLARLFR